MNKCNSIIKCNTIHIPPSVTLTPPTANYVIIVHMLCSSLFILLASSKFIPIKVSSLHDGILPSITNVCVRVHALALNFSMLPLELKSPPSLPP